MNPEIIYTNYRDEALAEKFSADAYSTFVAMPLADRFSYHPKEILEKVLRKAAKSADDERSEEIKAFLPPDNTLDIPGTANVITEDIVKKILASHFFVADLTDGNAGVLIETGIAMAFKPTSQIILITQHSLEELHFDIKENRAILYNPDGNIDKIKDALLAAAEHLEEERKKYVTQVSEGLTTDAIRTIHHYAVLYQNPEMAKGQPGLFGRYNEKGELEGNIPPFFKGDYGEDAILMFQLTIQELLKKRMLWTHFNSTRKPEGYDYLSWASHLTHLGWLLVKNFWPDFKSEYCERVR
ncbi:MAG: hypothetical protein EXS63_00050 [Candidatus Omnitrophica bacterium]|nr:hypothetical protein [Candidatus Omnitrophota bacterium]